jgi:hypothetical protein
MKRLLKTMVLAAGLVGLFAPAAILRAQTNGNGGGSSAGTGAGSGMVSGAGPAAVSTGVGLTAPFYQGSGAVGPYTAAGRQYGTGAGYGGAVDLGGGAGPAIYGRTGYASDPRERPRGFFSNPGAWSGPPRYWYSGGGYHSGHHGSRWYYDYVY